MKNFDKMSLTLLTFLTLAGASYGAPLNFTTYLNGAQEVPGVVTDTTGKCNVKFNKDLSEASFRIDVSEGTGITQAHFHCAPAGVNGPVVAFLFPFTPGGVDVDGNLNSGTLTNADIIPTSGTDACGLPVVNNLASLAAAMLDNRIYCNVHSLDHTGGVTRGQILE
jgi:hypothetical protein